MDSSLILVVSLNLKKLNMKMSVITALGRFLFIWLSVCKKVVFMNKVNSLRFGNADINAWLHQ